jgi:hypothetical protein
LAPTGPEGVLTADERRRLAEAVRAACIRAVEQGYENAATSGLCEEGALEAAISAIRLVDLESLLAELSSDRAANEKHL